MSPANRLYARQPLWLRRLLFWALLAVVAVTFGAIGFWVRDASPVLNVVSANIAPTVVAPGQTVTATWTVRAERQCPLRIERVVRDAVGMDYPAPAVQLDQVPVPVSMVGALSLSDSVPANAEGSITIFGTVWYWCNPLQEVFPRRIDMPPVTAQIETSAGSVPSGTR